MKNILLNIGAIAIFCAFASVPAAYAATPARTAFTDGQINALVNLLLAFNVDNDTLSRVYSALYIQDSEAPSVDSLVATPATVAPLEVVTLTMRFSHITTCDITSYDARTHEKINDLPGLAFYGQDPFSTSLMFTPSEDTEYRFDCTGKNGSSVTRSIVVPVK